MTTQTNLSTLRSRVTLFRAKEGRFPEALEELLTKTYQDMGVQLSYLEQIPSELISSKRGNSAVQDQTSKEDLTGEGGWVYLKDRAKVVVNITEPLSSQWGSYEGQNPSEW